MQRFTLLRGYDVHKFDALITGILIIRIFQRINRILTQFIHYPGNQLKNLVITHSH